MHQTRLLFLLPTEPMTNDTVSYVRRAALIASALIMIQHTEVTCPKVKEFRAMYAKIIADKHEDVMVKLGAIFAQGIIDAGGRNVTVSLQSRTGHTNMMAVVGMLIFTQVRKIVLKSISICNSSKFEEPHPIQLISAVKIPAD